MATREKYGEGEKGGGYDDDGEGSDRESKSKGIL